MHLKKLFLLLLLLPFASQAQEKAEVSWLKKLESLKIKPIASIQLWSTYTMGTEIFDANSGAYTKVDDRLNTQVRRTNLGVKAQPYDNIKLNITYTIDFVGRDLLAGTDGGVNNGASPFLRLWNATVQWRIKDQNDGFHLTMGYMPPQIGRASISSGMRASSLEKSWSQNYLRRHISGTGPGRLVGLNLGGLFLNETKKFGVSYNAGVFNPPFSQLNGNSAGQNFAPLLVGRMVFYFGDPEFEKYTMSRKTNAFGKRKGLSLAFAGSYQSESDIFTSNYAFGTDWLLNWGNFNMDGEWTILARTGELTLPNGTRQSFTNESDNGFVRASYNITLKNGKVLEPALMLVQFNGALDAADQTEAFLVNGFAGTDHYFSAGFNYFFNPDLKLSLHYIWRNGDLGDAPDGSTLNNYFVQGGVGAFKRGDWLGLGLVVIL